MTTATYLKFEVLRTFRNKRAFIFSIGIPIIMYYLLATPNRNSNTFLKQAGIGAPLFYMVGLLSFGGMVAALSTGARIAAERQVGWSRQLRLTPLTPRQYFRTKIVTGYLMVLSSMILLYAAGLTLGVRLSAANWLHMSLLVLVAIAPFAALGIALGHLLTVDSMGPALGGASSLFAFLGGTWFPITGHGAFVEFCKLLPSYWLTAAGRVGLGGSGDPWGTEGWLVIAGWFVVCAVFAMWTYRRDTRRV
ncbi:MAG: ABC transporter permease [Jatrophihabitans sp.]|uniref:ABC transporter permease n=1 Tax=Jatrophihabitans sp. TaxID=1932789 RepID=UPI003F8197A1